MVLPFLVTGVSELLSMSFPAAMHAGGPALRPASSALIALFTSAMVMLVAGANLFYVIHAPGRSWGSARTCSFPIGHAVRSARDAATKAFLVNGVADVGLAFWNLPDVGPPSRTLDIQAILSAAPQYADQTVNLLGWLGLEWQAPSSP